MAEEDLIFGKNRHFFGGIEPSNMLAFTAHGGMPQGQYRVFITATLPNDTVVNGQTLCTVKGAIIRRKTTDYALYAQRPDRRQQPNCKRLPETPAEDHSKKGGG